jgi:hypothetical protein
VISLFQRPIPASAAVLAVIVTVCGPARGVQAGDLTNRGAEIYKNQCLDCHGPHGEAVEDKTDEPLQGKRDLASLAKRIERTMPEDREDEVVGDDAKAVAAYIYDAFYSLAARARNTPAKIETARLTVPQYQATVADLVGGFRDHYAAPLGEDRGLSVTYTGKAPKKDKDDKPKEENVKGRDARIKFDYGDQLPEKLREQNLAKEEFSVKWEGSLIAEETGDYEFVVRTRNGARFYLNKQIWWDPKKGGQAAIDAEVASDNKVREEKVRVFLLGGRAYPLALTYFKYKDKEASIELLWKPPHGSLQTIPERNLYPWGVPESMVVDTPFPADDRSVGYERGTQLSRAWLDAVTQGAVAAANYVVANLDDLAKTKKEAPDRAKKIQDFAMSFVETAFRHPLTDKQRQQLHETFFPNGESPEQASKRLVIFAMTSPRFLYPDLPVADDSDPFRVASRLALALWDSLPDQQLAEAAKKGQLKTPQQIEQQASRMVNHPRSKAKMRGFFHHWLELDRADNVAKDKQTFPDYDDSLLSDLRTSLFLFLDDTVWNNEKSDYRQLLLADYLYLDERLAKIYGLKAPAAPAGFQRVAVDPKQRAGIVTHPFLLTTLAYHNSTSPIHRGVFLTRNILGMGLNSPPIANKFEPSKFDPSLTMREKVADMTRSKSCMACHVTINPLGFSLEHYDGIGRWQVQDHNKPINSNSSFKTASGDTIQLSGARDVATLAADDPLAHHSFIQQVFHHTVKQPALAYGPQTMASLEKQFVDSGYNIRLLLKNIAVTAAQRGVPSDS